MCLLFFLYTVPKQNRYVQATTHQGDIRLFSTTSVGWQCVTNSMQSMLFSHVKPPLRWSTCDLNDILYCGDLLHRNIHSNNHYLLATDLPKCIYTYETDFYIDIQEEIYGTFESNPQFGTSLLCALQNLEVSNEYIYALLCIGDSKSATGSTCAIMIYSPLIWIFDPHSRSCNGIPSGNGSALLTLTSGHHQAVEFLSYLSYHLHADTFTLTHVHIKVDVNKIQKYISYYHIDEEISSDNSIHSQIASIMETSSSSEEEVTSQHRTSACKQNRTAV